MQAAGILSPWFWVRITLYGLAGAIVTHFSLRSLVPGPSPLPLSSYAIFVLGIPGVFALQFGLGSFMSPTITVTPDHIRTFRKSVRVILREHVHQATLDTTDPLRVLLVLEYTEPEHPRTTIVFGVGPKVDLIRLAEVLGDPQFITGASRTRP